MKKFILGVVFISYLFGIKYTPEEQNFLKYHPVIYISSMTYWPVDKNGNSIHINYMKLLNKYGGLNLQPVFYKYWCDAFTDAKQGITYGIMALSYSKERARWFYYTRTYNYSPYYLIVKKDSDIKSLKDLKHKKVYIAQYSILRDLLKTKDAQVVYSKYPYEKLASGEIDAALVFYIPDTKYLKDFKIIKTFINKAGEEHIGINKKYPKLYSIIQKAMQAIPYSEIERIRQIPYEQRIQTINILEQNVSLKDLITTKDIILIVLLIVSLGVVLYFFLMRKFLNLKIKNFLISIFVLDIVILGFISYEIVVFNYYSNKILQIKSKSFNSLYIVDQIESSILNLDQVAKRAYFYHQNEIPKLFVNHYVNSDNLLVDGVALKNLLNTKYFTATELTELAYIKKLIGEILDIQKNVLNKNLDITIYGQKLLFLLEELKNIRYIIKKENTKEINIIKDKLRYQFLLLLFSVGIFILESVLLFIMIRKKIYNPISYLINVIKNNKNGKKIDYKQYRYSDEFGKLIDEFFDLQGQLNKKIDELNEHKENLEEEVKKEVEKRVYQENILLKKSKMAMMGEMIDAIAHQWKQPLGSISLGVQILKFEQNNLSSKEFESMITSIELQIQHMLTTIDQFRSFFRDNIDTKEVCIQNVIKKVLLLLKDEFMAHAIKIDIEVRVNFCIKGIENELEHLLITLLTNAKDIFIERNIRPRNIKIKTRQDDEFYYLEVVDNAGGVDEAIKDKIFDLNYTTRENGTGVGLYLASQIALKHNGVLEVENIENGAKFIFKVKKEVV